MMNRIDRTPDEFFKGFSAGGPSADEMQQGADSIGTYVPIFRHK